MKQIYTMRGLQLFKQVCDLMEKNKFLRTENFTFFLAALNKFLRLRFFTMLHNNKK